MSTPALGNGRVPFAPMALLERFQGGQALGTITARSACALGCDPSTTRSSSSCGAGGRCRSERSFGKCGVDRFGEPSAAIPIPIPSISFVPLGRMPRAICTALFRTNLRLGSSPHRVEEHERIARIQWPTLPFRDALQHGVGDGRNEVRRNIFATASRVTPPLSEALPMISKLMEPDERTT